MSFPERLLESLKHIGIKRHGAGAWLAKRTGTTVKAANKWLNGESKPLRNKVQIIAQITGTNIEWLEYGRGQMRPDPYISEIEGSYTHDPSQIDAPNKHTVLGINEVEVAFLQEADLQANDEEANNEEASDEEANKPTSPVKKLVKLATKTYRFNLAPLIKIGISSDNVVCCKVSGDSMAPVLPSNTIVAIDISQTKILDGKIYAIEHGGMLRIKYLYRLPFNGLRIRSANPDLGDEELNADSTKQVRVLGRVFWYSVLL